MVAGSHIHRTEFRNPMSSKYGQSTVPMLVSESVSPVYLNNPGYSTVKISKDGKTFNGVNIHLYQLQYYIFFGVNSWANHDPLKDYGMDFNKPQTLHGYPNFVQTSNDFGKFLAWEFGFDFFFQELVGKVLMPLYMAFQDKNFKTGDLCMMMYYEASDQALADCETKQNLTKEQLVQFMFEEMFNF